MQMRTDMVQYSISPYIPIGMNMERVESIKKYLSWKKLQDEIDGLKKDKEKLQGATLDIKDSKEQLAIFLVEEIKFAEQDLREEIKNWINHFGGTEMICMEKLIRLKNLQDIDINVDVPEKGLPSGITKSKRDKEIVEMSEKMETLKNKQEKLVPEAQKGKGQPFVEEFFWVSNWEKLSPLFFDPISVDGRFLNLENEVDRELEKIYFRLGYDKLAKVPFYKPLKIGGEDYKVPLSHGHPDYAKSKTEQSFV